MVEVINGVFIEDVEMVDVINEIDDVSGNVIGDYEFDLMRVDGMEDVYDVFIDGDVDGS